MSGERVRPRVPGTWHPFPALGAITAPRNCGRRYTVSYNLTEASSRRRVRALRALLAYLRAGVRRIGGRREGYFKGRTWHTVKWPRQHYRRGPRKRTRGKTINFTPALDRYASLSKPADFCGGLQSAGRSV